MTVPARRPSPLDDTVLLTIPEVARAARVSPMTIHRLVRSGEIDSVLIAARCVRIPEPAARRLLTGEQASPAPAGDDGE